MLVSRLINHIGNIIRSISTTRQEHEELESNWRYKSLESLEKQNYGPVPDDESSIISRVWMLEKESDQRILQWTTSDL